MLSSCDVVPMLYVFVVLGLVSSVLNQDIGLEERLRYDRASPSPMSGEQGNLTKPAVVHPDHCFWPTCPDRGNSEIDTMHKTQWKRKVVDFIYNRHTTGISSWSKVLCHLRWRCQRDFPAAWHSTSFVCWRHAGNWVQQAIPSEWSSYQACSLCICCQ